MKKRAIKHPLVTEKSAGAQATFNQYCFVVENDANKLEIKKEVEALKKDIEVISIKTAIVRGKQKRVGRGAGKRPNWKKAIVRLKAGQTLELYEAAV